MNPNNLFGRQQSAFQAPGNVSQSSGLFQPLGQQGASGTTPNIGFGQKPPFCQPSAFSQSSVFPQGSAQTSVFGQTSSFGQTPSFGQSGGLGQPSLFSSTSQASAFGQPAQSQATHGFGAPPSSSGQSQSPAFGQIPGFGQTTGFGETTSGFGISSNNSQLPSNSISSGASQPNFGQPSAFAFTSSAVSGQSNTQTSAFGAFKPPNENVFKPIFSVSPVPPSVQPVSTPEPFGVSKPVPCGSDTIAAGSSSVFTGVKPSTIGFSFSQPGTIPSAPVTSASIAQTTGGMTVANTPQFTFSQPANPSSSSIAPAAKSTISPSAFSFSGKVVQPQTVFRQPSFAFSGSKPEENPEIKIEDSSGESAIGSLGKGIKRKEESSDPNASQGKTTKVEEVQAESLDPRHPSKRPLISSRVAGGALFKSALSSLIKPPVNKKEEQTVDRASGERPDAPATDVSVPLTPPRPQAPIRHFLEKGVKPASESEEQTGTPSRRAGRGTSTDSLASISPSEFTTIHCKGLPPNLNRKDLIKQHFARYGKVHRVYCRPEKNLAIVHFNDNTSATMAKKKGKKIHGVEIQIFWQRKKQSPGTKRTKSTEVQEEFNTEDGSMPESSQSSPLIKPLLRPPAVSAPLVKGLSAKKSAVAKNLQFESEPQQDVRSERQSLDQPAVVMPSSLQPLIGQIAETAEEKYRLLEQRDKILRQLRSKRTDLDMSKVFVGTCPDMCPEKERYMRETRNQLSVFEVVSETEKVDHLAAIKEYSRSSADQEEPLPHELRPLPVLSMTMDYLVTQIMDQGEANYPEWYDFVWNRTRGIRKDITQQHLCDPITVSLIEICARFHIHCAHHLCQEPMRTFDAKINNENMTKCFQSLKEMYQDLATKNVYCPNEAEFRQYSILLKLNDGDILREVQQFRKEVWDSVEVKFAVQAFAALNSNNFVRFFKLVKSASYMSGCILHRYFNQIRSSALKALNGAYTVGSQRSTSFPLEDLVRMLMFHSASEATEFVQIHGLNVADGMVELSRTTYQEPDLPIPPKKSVAIEKKKVVLIGEVVNGGPLPNPPLHMPVCSFDSTNKYKGDLASLEALPGAVKVKPLVELDLRTQLKPKLVAEPRLFTESPPEVKLVQREHTQETGESLPHIVPVLPVNPQLMFQPIAESIVQPITQPSRPPSPKREPAYSDQDIMAEVDTVVEEILADEVLDVAKAGAQYVSAALSASEIELQTIVSDVVAKMLREVSAFEITAEKQRIAEEKRKLEEERQRKEREAFLDKLSSELCAEISEEVLAHCAREMADGEIKLALEEKAACVARCTELVCESLVEETLIKEIDCLVTEVVEAQLQQIHKFIKRWRDVVAVRRQLKRQMRGFPAAPCCTDPRFKLKALIPSAPTFSSIDTLSRGFINLGNAGNMVVSCTRLLKTRNETLRQMRVDYYYNLLLSERVWSPLDLPTLVAESTPNPSDRIFWKAALLLPSDQDSDMSSILTKWLEVKLGGGEGIEDSMAESEGKLKTLVIRNSLRDVGQKTHKVHLCVKTSRGPLSEEGQNQLEEQNELLGTSSLMMLLPSLSYTGLDDEDVPLLSALLQLKQVQQASGWNAALPLALLIPDQLEAVNDQKLEEVLMLKTLVQDGLISEYIFIHLSGSITDLQGSKQIGEAVRWLIAHSPASTVLSSQPLLQFIEGGLCREFYSRFLHDKQERARAALPCQEPEIVIQLYNSVLVYLAEVVSSERLIGISWPPPEFSLPENRKLVPHLDWNSPQHLDWLKRTILSLQIPVWKLSTQTAPWPHLCSSIFKYVSQIPSSAQSQPILMSHLEHLLARVRAQHLQRVPVDKECHRLSFDDIPWDDILILCVEHRLKDWHLVESPVEADTFTDDGEILVYYYKEQLKDFLPPESWVTAVKRTHTEKQQNTEMSIQNSTPTLTPAARFPRQRLFQGVAETEKELTVLDISHTPSPQELLPQRLLSGIQQEKAQSQRFEEQLQRWLTLEPLDSVSIPLFVPSTLLSMPEILISKHRHSASAACSIQYPASEDPAEMPSTYRKKRPVSLSQRLKDLDRLVLANREEELACSLKLNSLLEIIKD